MKILPTLLALALAATVQAQTPSGSKPMESKPMAKAPMNDSMNDKMMSDREFFTKAAQAGMTEVETGQMAASQAGSRGVKNFGQMMVTDHGKANAELKALAAKKGMTLPEKPDAQQQKAIADLHGKQGAAFDRLYVREAGVKGHQQAVALFEKAAKSHDSDVKAFAEKTLPTIRHHLDMARQLEGTTNAAYVKSLEAATQVAAAQRK